MLVKHSVLFCQRTAKLQTVQNLKRITIPSSSSLKEQRPPPSLTKEPPQPILKEQQPPSPPKESPPPVILREYRPLHFPELNYEWPYQNFPGPGRQWKFSSTMACFIVGVWGKSILTVLNTTKFNNLSVLNEAIFKRPTGIPLITVSNHESCIDDPCLIGAIMTNGELRQQSKMRWGLGAHDVCYKKRWHGWVMSHGKTIPTVRGMGVYQRAVDFAIERLNLGDWLHIFPEGKVNMERKELPRLKWGVGRIISDSNVCPIVIPFWHVGMQDVLPNHRPYYPRVGKKILINVGNPIDLRDLLKKIEDKSTLQKRKLITDVIQIEMQKLRLDTLELAKKEGMNA